MKQIINKNQMMSILCLTVDVFNIGILLCAGLRSSATKIEWRSLPKLQEKMRWMETMFSIYIFSPFNCAEPFGFYHSLLLIESGART